MPEIIRGARHGCASLLLSLVFMIVAEPTSALHASARSSSLSSLSSLSSSSSSSSSPHARESSSDACLSRMRTAVSMVTLQLVDRVRQPAEARAEMMRETSEVWLAAGVDVRWSKLHAAGTAEAEDVPTADSSHPQMIVIVRPDMPDVLTPVPSTVRVMASILFVGNRPTTLIAAYPAEVQRLLETVRMDARAVSERPAALGQRLMGRVLGRAIAHELGHFLFGSADHAEIGLMRARHRLDDLTSPFRRAFRVVPAQPLACGGLASMNNASGAR
jgi:hypothetical protein